MNRGSLCSFRGSIHRYGKFTIGFHRYPLLRNGFNPVLYTLQNTRIIRSIYNGISQLEFVDPSIGLPAN